MMSYINLEQNQKNKKIGKIVIISVLILSIIIIGICSIINNNDNKSFRRKIGVIEDDISNLYNYTETMSDFIVDNYKLPEVIPNSVTEPSSIQFNLLLSKIENFKNESLKSQLDLKEEVNNFKEQSLKSQLDLKEEVNNFKEQSLKSQLDLKKITLRKLAIEFLKNNFGFNQNKWLFINNNCGNRFENINQNNYYESFLKIDYDNFIVSFAYLNDDYKEDLQATPLYKLLNNSLEFDYEFLTDRPYILGDNIYFLNNNLCGALYCYYYRHEFELKNAYKPLCNVLPYEFEEYMFISFSRRLTKIYDEYEYISRIISFSSISPQKFL